MKLLTRNKLSQPIKLRPGDSLRVVHHYDGQQEVLSEYEFDETNAGVFNVSFIYELEPGELDCERGLIGGIGYEHVV